MSFFLSSSFYSKAFTFYNKRKSKEAPFQADPFFLPLAVPQKKDIHTGNKQ
jgi:hypothetical protein